MNQNIIYIPIHWYISKMQTSEWNRLPHTHAAGINGKRDGRLFVCVDFVLFVENRMISSINMVFSFLVFTVPCVNIHSLYINPVREKNWELDWKRKPNGEDSHRKEDDHVQINMKKCTKSQPMRISFWFALICAYRQGDFQQHNNQTRFSIFLSPTAAHRFRLADFHIPSVSVLSKIRYELFRSHPFVHLTVSIGWEPIYPPRKETEYQTIRVNEQIYLRLGNIMSVFDSTDQYYVYFYMIWLTDSVFMWIAKRSICAHAGVLVFLWRTGKATTKEAIIEDGIQVVFDTHSPKLLYIDVPCTQPDSFFLHFSILKDSFTLLNKCSFWSLWRQSCQLIDDKIQNGICANSVFTMYWKIISNGIAPDLVRVI